MVIGTPDEWSIGMLCGDKLELDEGDHECHLEVGHDGRHEEGNGWWWETTLTCDLTTGEVTVH